ncbi:Protein phosphatase 1 regulatory subunit 32-like isoform X2 [Oopsacas minuta]|uniref:Protein phosphatase 1 regulatory subunit 32-like isoform X2 n=1 Tax=Oopsacas minuta TaxID=111878 RepID=A0AAV7JW26_9METZ|nr:Protein phosphatase 1 regulatory subunit 32-like isoform X2 [Oopsacas minuta]
MSRVAVRPTEMKEPGKRQIGTPYHEILCSRGTARRTAYDFYSTAYDHYFGQPEFHPRVEWRGNSTGYGSNFRPSIGYNYGMDAVDNPSLGENLRKNKDSTVYRQDFDLATNKANFIQSQPPALSGQPRPAHGDCPAFLQLPTTTYQTDMGYTKDIPSTRPFHNNVQSVHVDTREQGPGQVLGVKLPHQAEPQGRFVKTRVEEENSGLGPFAFSTEQKAAYTQKSNRFSYEGPRRLMLGGKEETGFTHSKQIEPITFRRHEALIGNERGTTTTRPTSRSAMKDDFHVSSAHVKNVAPPHYGIRLCHSAEISNGFTKGHRDLPEFLLRKAEQSEAYTSLKQVPQQLIPRIQQSNPAEFMNLKYTTNKMSVMKDSFPQHVPDTDSHPAKDWDSQVGLKEASGFVNNKEIADHPNLERDQFDTHYKGQFFGKTDTPPVHRVATAPQFPPRNGYTKSTQVHSLGEDQLILPSTTNRMLREQRPMRARVMMSKDPILMDSTHLHKMRST